MELVSRDDRDQKVADVRIHGLEFTIKEIASIARQIKESRRHKHAESYDIDDYGENGIRIVVTYLEIEPLKTRALQYSEKKVDIIIEKLPTHLGIRFTNNDKGVLLSQAIRSTLVSSSKVSVTSQEISLVGIQDAAKRTLFFSTLMSGISGHKIKDVSEIKLQKIKTEDIRQDGDKDAEAKEEKNKTEAEAEVKKCLLKGNGIIRTILYQELTTKGFFISSAKWIASPDDDSKYSSIEFLAEFTNGEEGSGFRYKVGATAQDNPSDEKPVRLSALDRQEINSLLEEAAFKSIAQFEEEAGGENE